LVKYAVCEVSSTLDLNSNKKVKFYIYIVGFIAELCSYIHTCYFIEKKQKFKL